MKYSQAMGTSEMFCLNMNDFHCLSNPVGWWFHWYPPGRWGWPVGGCKQGYSKHIQSLFLATQKEQTFTFTNLHEETILMVKGNIFWETERNKKKICLT